MTAIRRWSVVLWGGMLLAVAVAALLRLPALDSIPPGLGFDEAGNGVAAMDVARGQVRVWWPIGGGKEPLIAYLLQPLFWILGPTRLALRLYPALMGLITVAGTYWLAWEMFVANLAAQRDSKPAAPSSYTWIPLLAALGLATAFWHVAYSRVAFRALAMPAVAVLALAWLWRAMRGGERVRGRIGRWSHFVGAGLLIGLGPYTYLTGRLAPLALALFFALEAGLAWLRRERPLMVRHFRGLTLAAVIALLIFLPLALFFIQNPGAFGERAGAISVFSPTWNRDDLWGTLLRTTLSTLGTFTAQSGDLNPMGNLPGRPMLGPVLAPFFWLGLLVSVWRIVTWVTSASYRHNPTHSLQYVAPYLLLLCWWLVMLLPGILAPEGAPHHLRIIGTAPVTYILVAVGLHQIANLFGSLANAAKSETWRLASVKPPKPMNFLVFRFADWLPVLIFLPIGVVTARDYFVRWVKLPELYMAFDVYAVELAEQMAGETDPSAVYVIPMDLRAGHEARHYTLDFYLPHCDCERHLGDIPYNYLPVDETTIAPRMTQIAAGRKIIRVVWWLQDKHAAADERELVRFLLAGVARPVSAETYPVYRIQTWELPSAHTEFTLPTIDGAVWATYGDVLRLETAHMSVREETVAVALRWAPLAAMDVDYKASVRLVAPDGSVVAQKDRFLRHNWHQGTSQWPPETVNEYYLLPLVPPGEYEVQVVVYHPETLAPLMANGGYEVSLDRVHVK
jgi:4-amino-4-deoxy-L-arabinose transferase-like glycosyltransferase